MRWVTNYYVVYLNSAMIFFIRSGLLVYEIMTNDLIYFPFLYVFITILILKYFIWAY